MGKEELIFGSILMGVILGSVMIISHLISKYLPSSAKIPQFIYTWLIFTSIITLWDLGFVLNRPHSISNPIWKASYGIYIEVDTLYDDLNDDFIYSVALMNLVEVVLNIISLLTLCTRNYKGASILALIASSMTLSKTMLYFMMEVVGGFKHTGHNDAITLFTFYLFPNLIWIFVPLIAIYSISLAFIDGQIKVE
ncbi:hypothetical protein LOD99_4455 [Oopsacas minuta]|uniref:Emopamil-binding protein n=1 Tax=Oopsacas minuta TaxID=111878 RepID=A0AAV7JV33_9METZ|nr:hypothetical protein LOD99_4455 [Oopsacas minuta]